MRLCERSERGVARVMAGRVTERTSGAIRGLPEPVWGGSTLAPVDGSSRKVALGEK